MAKPFGIGIAAHIVILTLIACQPASAEPGDLRAVVDALKATAERMPPPPRIGTGNPRFVFPITLTAEPRLTDQLNKLFGAFFDRKVDLEPLARQILAESAVAEIPGLGKLLYDPAHSLFLLVRDSSSDAPSIDLTTVSDLASMVGDDPHVDLALGGYTVGFGYFSRLPTLLADAENREALRAFVSSPRSKEHKDLVQYLLLRPIQQAIDIRNETPACRRAINRFVNDVRDGKRSEIPMLPGLSNILRPSRYVRQADHTLLVLSDPLIARFYVVGLLAATNANCSVIAETALFVM